MRRFATMAWMFAISFLTATVSLASPPLTVVHPFDLTMGQLPESVTTDAAGNLFISVGGTVSKYTTDHQLVTLATLPLPNGGSSLGIKVGPDGALYVASAAFTPGVVASFVWRVSPTGQVSVFATLPPEGIPNDLAFDERGDLYVTDSGLGQIWKIGPNGKPEVWLADPLLQGDPAHPAAVIHALGANGLAFDRSGHYLYVSNTDYGRILRIRIQHGQARDIDIVATSPLLVGADGIALDILGTLYVAVNTTDRIVTVDHHGAVAVLVEGSPLDSPSSLAFGSGCADHHTLYLTNFAIQHALGIRPGMPAPSLASVPVPFRGIDLP